MGLVYEATQKGIGGFRKVVAIKLIREEYSAIEEFRNNFIGEAKLVADLIHTNIVQTYHLGKIGEQYFMTMEFVTGWNLEEFLDRHDFSESTNSLLCSFVNKPHASFSNFSSEFVVYFVKYVFHLCQWGET